MSYVYTKNEIEMNKICFFSFQKMKLDLKFWKLFFFWKIFAAILGPRYILVYIWRMVHTFIKFFSQSHTAHNHHQRAQNQD